MVEIRPEWLQYAPDDFSGLPMKELLCQAGVFGRAWRTFWITVYSENVLDEQEQVDLMERLYHAFVVALRCRRSEVLEAMEQADIPIEDIDVPGNAMLAASLYENRMRGGS